MPKSFCGDIHRSLIVCTAEKLNVPYVMVFWQAANSRFRFDEKIARAAMTHASNVWNRELYLLSWVESFCRDILGIKPNTESQGATGKNWTLSQDPLLPPTNPAKTRKDSSSKLKGGLE